MGKLWYRAGEVKTIVQWIAAPAFGLLACMNEAIAMNTARPKATPCEEGRSTGLLDKVLALAYGMFFVSLAVAGSLWILADLSATLLPVPHVR